MRLTVGKRLAVGMGVIMGLLLSTGLISFLQTRTVSQSIEEITVIEEPMSAATYEMEINAVETGFGLFSYLHDRNPLHLDDIEVDQRQFGAAYNTYNTLAMTESYKALGSRVSQSYDRFKNLAETLIKIDDNQHEKIETLLLNLDRMDFILDEQIQASIKPDDPHAYRKLEAGLEMEINTNGIAKGLGNYLRTRHSKYEARVHKDQQDFERYIAVYGNLSLSAQERRWAAQVRQLFDDSVALAKEIIELENTKEQQLAQFVSTRQELDALLDSEIQRRTHEDLTRAKTRGLQSASVANLIIITLLALASVCSIGVAIFTARSITRPVNHLVSATTTIAKGNLSHRVQVTARDELGVLGESFNAMTEELQRTLVSRDYLENIIDSMAEMLIVISPEGKIETMNAAACSLLEYEAAELIGQPFDRITEGASFLQELGFGDQPVGKSLLRNAEMTFHSKSGKAIPVVLSASMMSSASNGLPRVVCVALDLSERKQAEWALQSAHERYQSLVQNAISGIYFATPDGRFKEVNPALVTMLGYESEEELMGINIATDICQSRDEYARLLTHLQQVGSKRGVEMKWIRKDGQLVTVSVNGRGNPGQSGSLEGYEVIVEDITERRLLEEQLRQSQKMEAIGRLAGGVAHDFNNLLTVVAGNADVLLMRLGPDDALSGYARNIKNVCERASDLTHQLLVFSRSQVLQPRRLDLNEIVSNTAEIVERLISDDIDLVLSLDPALEAVLADPVQIGQVILNLLVNARDAMPQGGALTVETANVYLRGGHTGAGTVTPVQPGHYVMIAVSDTGCGIDQQTLTHIFEPFFTTKEKGKGTGLGLATVYGIVKQSEGQILVQSEVGRGTTFNIYLPRAKSPANSNSGADPLPMQSRSKAV